jgi:hypothetical protein
MLFFRKLMGFSFWLFIKTTDDTHSQINMGKSVFVY